MAVGDALSAQTAAAAAAAAASTESAEPVMDLTTPLVQPIAITNPEPVAIDANSSFAAITEELRNLQGTGATVINTDLYIDGGLLRQYLIGKGTGVLKVTT